jgi:hypothetical protein
MTEEEIERFALPLREAERVRQRILEEGAAYLAGWEEGLFAPLERTALHSKAIALYEGSQGGAQHARETHPEHDDARQTEPW